ncbi:MAG: hypothetical protein KA787_04425 [Bacteroidia bacterium]|nr:hypothetical protein [Bacteroidia bacterium]
MYSVKHTYFDSNRKSICHGHIMPVRWITFLLFFLVNLNNAFSQATVTASGTWATATWSPAAPVAGQSVIVNVGCTLTVDQSTPPINDLTINGVVIISNTAVSIMTIGGNITVNAGGRLENNGVIEFTTAGKNFTLNGNATYVHNPRNNALLDESIFELSNEVFSATSNLIIQKWFDPSVPLGSADRVQSSIFGNVTLSAPIGGPGNWDQDGCFALPVSNRIRGKLTVTEGTIVMDDGTGNTSNLALGDVDILNNGNIVFQRGQNRSLTMTSGNFNLSNNIAARTTTVMDTSFGVLNWTINGNMTINGNFNAVFGNNYSTGADIRVTVNGNLTIGAGISHFVNKADAPLRVTVSGTTTLAGMSGGTYCTFIEGGNGNLNFITNNLVVSGGQNWYFAGNPAAGLQAKGTVNVTINNDFNISGVANIHFAWADSMINTTTIIVSRDLNLTGSGTLIASTTNSALIFRVLRNWNHSSGKFIGQNNPNCSGAASINVGVNFTFSSIVSTDAFIGNRGNGTTTIQCSGNWNVLSSGSASGQGVIGVDGSASSLTFSVTGNFVQNGGRFIGSERGSGNINITVNGILDMNAGTFRGILNTTYSVPANATFLAGSIDYDGGLFSVYHAANNNGSAGTMSVLGNCKVNFGAVSDEFYFIGIPQVIPDVNTLILNLTISGTLTISGANGKFVSSEAGNTETITIGNINISNGRNSFNGEQGSTYSNGHLVNLTVNGAVNISGGTTFLSAFTFPITATINGDITITGGDLSIKGDANSTISNVNVLGGFFMSGGNFYFHNNASVPVSSSIWMTVNSNDDLVGDFVHTAGNIYFDNGNPSSSNLKLVIKSPSITWSGSGQITTSNPGTGTAFGSISFARTGTSTFNRAGTHLVQQVYMTVESGNTLDLAIGDIQLASHPNMAGLPLFLMVNNNGVLNMRTNKLFSNALEMYSGISVLGRVRTQNVNGIYDATTNASFSTTVDDSLDYYLSSGSTVEYNGVDNQIVSGVGLGRARSMQHRYGNLEINFGGTANTEFVYPTNAPNDSAVWVRGNLLLTNGELNLDNDHVPSNSGGRMVYVETSAATGIQRTNGYIRSETEDGSGRLKWNIAASTGAHVVPFGYDASNYIPFTYNMASGSTGSLYAATYRTNAANLPYPPTVTHVRNNSNVDNSANTVDRFWYLQVSGTTTNAALTFVCTPSELGSIASPRAQRWVAPMVSWTNPPPGTQSNPASNSALATGVGVYNNWWTLAGASNLLPIELLAFEGKCEGTAVVLRWVTASETNNDHFTLERSADGISWETLAMLPGAGNSTVERYYSFNDNQPLPGIGFYRLTQTDFDGVYEVFDPIKVRSCETLHDLTAVVTGSIGYKKELLVESPDAGNYQLELLGSGGQLLWSAELSLIAGFQRIELPTDRLASGIYFVRLNGEKGSLSRKFAVQQ